MPKLFFKVLEGGKLPDGIKQSLLMILPELAGKEVYLEITEKKEKRNNPQNSYYWSQIIPHVRKVRAELGDPVSEETVHEELLHEFAPRVEGKAIKTDYGNRPMRSKEMSVKEFSEYVTAITAAMAAFGHPVPIKEEQ